jgi:hypothetical protein
MTSRVRGQLTVAGIHAALGRASVASGEVLHAARHPGLDRDRAIQLVTAGLADLYGTARDSHCAGAGGVWTQADSIRQQP